MTQRPDRISISLGPDAKRLKRILIRYVTDHNISADIRPSISEMLRQIAKALDFDYPQASNLLDDLMTLAGTAHMVEAEEMAERATEPPNINQPPLRAPWGKSP